LKKKDTRIIISIFCDYGADGLWENGGRIDCNYLLEERGFDQDFIESVQDDLEKWQCVYQGFNFYGPEEEQTDIFRSGRFVIFEALGRKIWKAFLVFFEENPEYQDKFILEFFDEGTAKRIRAPWCPKTKEEDDR